MSTGSRGCTHATGQAVANLAQRVGASQMAKEHRDALRPTGEPLRGFLGAVFSHEPLKFRARKVIKQLTKQTGVS